MAQLFSDEARLDDTQVHIKQAKLPAINGNNTYFLARAIQLQTGFWHRQRSLWEAESETLGAVDMFEKLGTAGVRNALGISSSKSIVTLEEMDDLVIPHELHDYGELLATVPLVMLIYPSYSHRDTYLKFFNLPFCKPPTPPPFTPSRIEFSNTDTVLPLPTFSPITRIPPSFSSPSTHTHRFISVALPLVRGLYLPGVLELFMSVVQWEFTILRPMVYPNTPNNL